MATYYATRVRKERSADGTHEHIAGVCTGTTYWTRRQVVDSISSGDAWYTDAGGSNAKIEPINYCPRGACLATPYIRTNPNGIGKDNLENLDRC
jgi:hypothetical protein